MDKYEFQKDWYVITYNKPHQDSLFSGVISVPQESSGMYVERYWKRKYPNFGIVEIQRTKRM